MLHSSSKDRRQPSEFTISCLTHSERDFDFKAVLQQHLGDAAVGVSGHVGHFVDSAQHRFVLGFVAAAVDHAPAQDQAAQRVRLMDWLAYQRALEFCGPYEL